MAVIIKNRQVENNPWQLLRPGADNAFPAVPPTGDVIVSLTQWQAQKAALLVREMLDKIGLTGYPKTTGGDGMHIFGITLVCCFRNLK